MNSSFITISLNHLVAKIGQGWEKVFWGFLGLSLFPNLIPSKSEVIILSLPVLNWVMEAVRLSPKSTNSCH